MCREQAMVGQEPDFAIYCAEVQVEPFDRSSDPVADLSQIMQRTEDALRNLK
jgi:hypothetical protein